MYYFTTKIVGVQSPKLVIIPCGENDKPARAEFDYGRLEITKRWRKGVITDCVSGGGAGVDSV
jgi:hypothetical protein